MQSKKCNNDKEPQAAAAWGFSILFLFFAEYLQFHPTFPAFLVLANFIEIC